MSVKTLYVITGKYRQEPLLISNSKKAIEKLGEPFDYGEDEIVEVPFVEDGSDDDISDSEMLHTLALTCVHLIDDVKEMQERVEALESQVRDAE